jgi:dUTP pyrophosphatase
MKRVLLQLLCKTRTFAYIRNYRSLGNITNKSFMKFSKVKDVKSPARGTNLSAGIDFFVPNDFQEMTLLPNQRCLIPSGIKVSLPPGYALIAFNKSGVASKTGMIVGACVVDEDYQGEVHINMINTSDLALTIHPGDKLTQFILIPVNYVHPSEVPIEELYVSETERGQGGFGSTGDK